MRTELRQEGRVDSRWRGEMERIDESEPMMVLGVGSHQCRNLVMGLPDREALTCRARVMGES